MLLTEAEGKELFKRAGLTLPDSEVVTSVTELAALDHQRFTFPVFCKAQVLHGNRALQHLIRRANNFDELQQQVTELLTGTDQYSQPITAVLLEQGVSFTSESYLALTYDTHHRSLVAQYSPQGGTGMDDRGETLQTVPLSSLEEPSSFAPNQQLLPTVQKLWHVIRDNDALLVEVNPLVYANDQYLCLDAKVELEDTARFRHEEWQRYSSRSGMGRPPTELETKAHQVSAMDHRGVAGESFFEFIGGDVGVMASGGGASLLAMDALMAAGISPANYTEYSGNPTREKTKALTDVVLSIENLKGLYVVGSNANFTDIYETLAGVIDGLLDSSYAKPGFKILIRRGGPRWEEAFEMVKQRLAGMGVEYKLFGPDFPIVETAAKMKQLLAGT